MLNIGEKNGHPQKGEEKVSSSAFQTFPEVQTGPSCKGLSYLISEHPTERSCGQWL